MHQLPEDSIFGGTTAACQVEGATKEGGKGPVAWDDFLAEQGRFSPDPASDFYRQYPQDTEFCEKSGVNGLRLSTVWNRIFPNGIGEISQEGIGYYHKMFAECQRRNIIAFVMLHHFDTPKVLFDNGDLLNRDTIEAFVNYAKFCFKEFTEVRHWSTFNGTYPVTTNQYLLGIFPPGIKYDLSKVIQCLHDMMYAHTRMVNLFKDGGYQGEIGVIHSLGTKYPATDNRGDKHVAFLDDALSIQFLLNATYLGYYSNETMEALNKICAANNANYDFLDSDFEGMKRASHHNDYLGINHYQCHFIRAYNGENAIHHNGTDDKGTSVYKVKGIGERIYKEGIPRTNWDWIIYSEGLYGLLLRIKADYPHYNKIYIAESDVGYKDEFDNGIIMDQPRIDYLKVYLQSLAKAIDTGVNVKGYLLWPLMDLFSWSNGYNKRYGLFYADFETQERYPKASAYWYKHISDTKIVE